MPNVLISYTRALLIVILFVFNRSSIAQDLNNLGVHTITNYSAKSYGMHPRNTYISQDLRGVLYVGNHYGVINFDGNYWKSTHLPNGTSAYSITLGHDSKMYVGCHSDLGYITYNTIGQSKYHSLLPLLPASQRNMGAIWEIIATPNATLFFSNSKLFLYNNTLQIISPTEPTNQFQFAQKIGQDVFVNESNKGLQKLTTQGLKLIEGGDFLKNHILKSLIKIDDEQFLVIESKKVYLFKNGQAEPLTGNINNALIEHECTHAIALADKKILITTSNNGLYLISQEGHIIKNITVDNGLQSNSIHYAYLDDKNNVWLALDNGVAYLELNSPFSFIGHSNGVSGMGFSSAIFNNKLYLATSQGVYYTTWDQAAPNGIFKPVRGIEGQVWSLSVINNTLLCCHANGSFQIENDTAIPLKGNSKTDNWKFKSLENHPNYAIKGTENGFELYFLKNNRWNFVRILEGFNEACRLFVEDKDNTLWVCHGNKGLYKLKLSNDLLGISKVQNISSEQNFAADFFLDVSIINKHIAIASQQGIYTIDYNTNKIIKDIALEKLFGSNLYINKIAEFEDNIWLFLGDEILLYQKSKEGHYIKISDVLRKLSGNLVGSYEFVMPLNKAYSIIGSQDGFVVFNTSNEATHNRTPYSLVIRKVEANFKNDSILFGGNFSTDDVASLSQSVINKWPYQFNSLRITYSALFYESPEKTNYQYALQNSHNSQLEWSGWTNNTQVVLSNLSEGNYTFHVRSKNIYGQLSKEGIYSFVITPPWYRSIYAFLFYTLIIAIAIYFIVRTIRKRFKIQRQKLEAEKETELKLLEQEFLTEIIRKEKEIVTIKNEQLEENVMRKKNELASLATNLNQKTELLFYLKEKFKNITQDEPTPTGDNLLKEVMKTIDQQFDMDDNWSKFQSHFDEMHHNFLQRLQENYPKLDQSWLLLCAYIRMNKSNKEMATLLNISVAAVEKRRYRLKDKLELDNDSKLVDFILNF